MNVVPMFDMNGADIVQQLRALADRVEAGEVDCDTMLLVADVPGDIDLYGWGKIDGMRCVGLLHMAAHKLTRDTLDWLETEQEVGGSS